MKTKLRHLRTLYYRHHTLSKYWVIRVNMTLAEAKGFTIAVNGCRSNVDTFYTFEDDMSIEAGYGTPVKAFRARKRAECA